MSVIYHLGKANKLADALNGLSMSSVTTWRRRKKLVHDVHRLAHLGICLVGSVDGKIIVQNNLRSSHVIDVKANIIMIQPLLN